MSTPLGTDLLAGQVLEGVEPVSPAGAAFTISPEFGSVFAGLLFLNTDATLRARMVEAILRFSGAPLLPDDACREIAGRIRDGEFRAEAMGAEGNVREFEQSLSRFAEFLEDAGGIRLRMDTPPPFVPKDGFCSRCFQVFIAQSPAPEGQGLLVLNPIENAVLAAMLERVGGNELTMPQSDRLRNTGDLVLAERDAVAIGNRLVAATKRSRVRLRWLVKRVEDLLGSWNEAEAVVCDVLRRSGEFFGVAGGISAVRMPERSSDAG
jgi:hypothetical protein